MKAHLPELEKLGLVEHWKKYLKYEKAEQLHKYRLLLKLFLDISVLDKYKNF